ncbi:MAG TPA: ABC transporter substrate-binding protein [Kofleriaceae bacterium]|jgi:branched-chain amino acid transport system substrate-binding protein|nr:ABC transporter substrate-binding protein [Kofleriaceae bacterium]
MNAKLPVAVLACLLAASPARAQIKIAVIQELSGTGATAGTNFKNGVDLAVKEINAAGGILGQKLEPTFEDTQSNPGVAKGLVLKAVDDGVFAVFGPTFSGSMAVTMAQTRRAGVPNFTGADAASLTQQGNPYIFRTSFTQLISMPRVAHYIAGALKARRIAVIFVNNDFGKAGRDAFVKAAAAEHLTVVADISTEAGQLDFAAPVLKAKQSDADALFVYTNEEESARCLRELRKQAFAKPIIGETTLAGQRVIELAGAAANGVFAHVGLTVDAPIPAVREFAGRFEKAYKYVPDHNGLKGYTSVYFLKAGIEAAGKLDRVAVAKALHGLKIRAATHPGVLMDVAIDDHGDLDRASFIVQVKDGKQEVKEVLPPVGKF